MIFSHIKKKRFIPTLFILLTGLQISACSTDNGTSAAINNAEQNNQTINKTNTNITTISDGIGNNATPGNNSPDSNNFLDVNEKPNIANNRDTNNTSFIANTVFGVDKNTTTANINLSWTAPVAREDNTPLSLASIAGYKIYYGTAPGQYISSASINDSSATGYVFNNFSSATYYFVVTAIDTDGRESQYSTEIIINI